MGFLKKYKTAAIVTTFILVSLFLISSNNRKGSSSVWYENVFVLLIAPFQQVTNSLGNALSTAASKYVFLVGLYDENILLRKENLSLRGENYHLKEIEQENKRLRELLNFKKQVRGAMLLPAEVIAVDSKSDFKTIRINKGKVDGVKEQLPVVTSEGIVGQILRVYRYYSEVLLITDRYSAVDAIIQRVRSRGVLEGDIHNCSLKYLLRGDDVSKGDLIISSGLDMVFPRGLPLGYVSDVKKEKFGISQHVTVTPVVDFSRLEEILVVLKKGAESSLQNMISDGDEN